MIEPTIACPKCQTEIKLTESLAAPLLASTKKHYEQLAAEKEEQIRTRERLVSQQQAKLAEDKESLDELVASKLKAERAAIASTEAKKARDAMADEIAKAQQEKVAMEELLKQRDAKLAAAQKNELELRQERQRLQEEKEGFELEKQRAIDAERAKIREAAHKDADEQSRLKIAEKDKTISDLQVKLQDALRKAEQGSQQLQGEVQELELENILRVTFPSDTIDPVAKGEFGGDIHHQVFGPASLNCGLILWESKRTKKWSDTWLPKLREDQRTAKAEIAVIVSQVLPKGIETFGCHDGVWVTRPQTVIPVAMLIRRAIIEVAQARQAREGQQTKMEMIYDYLTGPQFRCRLAATLEKFTELQNDLEKERRWMTRQWKKREQEIRTVIDSTQGMIGDLQGIAGKSLESIEELALPALPACEDSEDTNLE